jgi:amino acid transporter
MTSPLRESEPVRAHLGLWDAISIIIGIVIGAGIYETAPYVFSQVSGPWMALGVWALAGVLCLIGSLCYAELATTYPRLGGDYVYLTRAYGAPVGFLYGWAQLAVIQTASIGMMAYVFADYAAKLWAIERGHAVWLAILPVVVLAALNIMGVVFGKGTQNILSAAKVVGLGGILIAGFFWGHGWSSTETGVAASNTSLAAAFVPVFLTYGGWNDAAFVVAELRNRRRNIPLALCLGTLAVTIIYVAVNAAYLAGLGFDQARKSEAIAAAVLELARPGFGGKAMSLLVMVSALGAINGLIFTSSRIYATLGSDYSTFAWLGRWNQRVNAPVASLFTLTLVSIAMIALVGTQLGRGVLNQAFSGVGFSSLQWEGQKGFNTLLQCSAPVFWLFFLLTGLSLFVLRLKDRGLERPFRVPLFPIVPLIFCATCAYMLYGGILYADKLGLVGAALVLIGVPLYFVSAKTGASGPSQNAPVS